ncbi:hypothetical protein HRbin15_02177 [bacterium HR15]|nr:hypothetical protein HRbin15_02177 [bacterium HR15]
MEKGPESVAGDWRVASEAGLTHSRFYWLTRPMSPFEMMDDAVAFFRENFSVMAKASILLYAPLIILVLITLIIIVALNATARTPQPFAPADLIYLASVCLAYPYFFVAPALHAAIISLIAHMRLQNEPVTLRSVWERLKTRFWHLIANQLLAFIVLGGINLVIGIFFFALLFLLLATIGVTAGTAGGAFSVIIGLIGALLLSILWVVAIAMATVWFIILPQIVVLEPNTDALTAFNRAFQLVGKNYRHAVLSYLAFIGFQTVVYLAAYMLLIMVVAIAVLIIHTYFDLDAFFMRWSATLNQSYNLITYVGFALLMPMMYLTSFLLYYDLRYRIEGLDIEQALTQMEG